MRLLPPLLDAPNIDFAAATAQAMFNASPEGMMPPIRLLAYAVNVCASVNALADTGGWPSDPATDMYLPDAYAAREALRQAVADLDRLLPVRQ